MATIAATKIWTSHDGSIDMYEWVLTSADTGGWLVLPWKSDKTVQWLGTFTGPSSLQGTLETGSAPAGPGILTDPGGTALTASAAGIPQVVLQNCYQYRITGPASGTATVRLMATRGAQ